MKTVTYTFNYVDKDLWNTLENNAKHLSVFQTHSWAETLNSIGTKPFFFVIKHNENPLLGLLLFKSRFAWGILHTYEAMGGPLCVSDVDEGLLSSFAERLKIMVKKRHGFSFYWVPSPLFKGGQHFVERGFSRIPSATFIVDLEPPRETLWRNLEKRARWTVRKAWRSEVDVVEAKDWQDWKKFHDLYVKESSKATFPPYSLSLHKAIYDKLTQEAKAVLFVAKHQNKIISGMVYLLTRNEMVNYRGASEIEYLRLGGTSAMHWHAISWAKDRGIRYYDLGGALWEPLENHSLFGVHMFKRQWGGRLQRYYSLALGKSYVIGRNLFYSDSDIRRLYLALEKLKAIERTDRV